jgi:hypothetical protein
MELRGHSFVFGGQGGRGVFFCCQVVFGVENGLSTVHFPLGQGTVDFPCKLFGGGG